MREVEPRARCEPSSKRVTCTDGCSRHVLDCSRFARARGLRIVVRDSRNSARGCAPRRARARCTDASGVVVLTVLACGSHELRPRHRTAASVCSCALHERSTCCGPNRARVRLAHGVAPRRARARVRCTHASGGVVLTVLARGSRELRPRRHTTASACSCALHETLGCRRLNRARAQLARNQLAARTSTRTTSRTLCESFSLGRCPISPVCDAPASAIRAPSSGSSAADRRSQPAKRSDRSPHATPALVAPDRGPAQRTTVRRSTDRFLHTLSQRSRAGGATLSTTFLAAAFGS